MTRESTVNEPVINYKLTEFCCWIYLFIRTYGPSRPAILPYSFLSNASWRTTI